MRGKRSLSVVCALATMWLAFIPCGEAATPWGMIAGRVLGRVKQLSQKPTEGQPGFDVATVILNADAAKVYATTVGMLRRNQSLRITAQDDRDRTVEFSNGARSAGITVTDLGTRLSQILVASAIKPGEDSATLRIVDGILRVCQEMKVTCSER
jgi:hypothetical protein